jgi:hypothetical protein
MPFESGHKKLGGRKKGTPNKMTANIRTKLEEILEGQTDTIEADLKELSPKDRVRAYTELLKYVLPVKKDIEVSNPWGALQSFLDIPDEQIKNNYDLS